MTNKMTFGFRNVNGAAVKIKLLESPTGRFPSEKTIKDIRSYIIKAMNKAGRQAVTIAKTPGHSPYLTGALVRSISWRKAREGLFDGGVVTGGLEVGVPYGRRQEFENKTRSRYLQRAIQQAMPQFLADLRERRVMEDVIFARRRQSGVGFF